MEILKKGGGTVADNRRDAGHDNMRGAARGRRPDPYSRGNGNWNTESYKQSVKTERTDTRVIGTDPERRAKKGTYFYDYTVTAERERKKQDFEEIREEWKARVRKNKRLVRFGKRLASFVVIIISLVFVLAVVYKVFFVADNIIIEGNETYTDEEIISASGLDVRTNLYSFNSRVAANSIRFFCPNVADAVFDRKMPDNVKVKVKEEKPLYFANLYGEVFTLSPSLRVLGRVTEADTAGLIELKLQRVSFAVTGSEIILSSERAQKFLEKVNMLLSSSELRAHLNSIDLKNDFDIYMAADSRFKMRFGSQDDFEIKIKLAEAIINDSVFASGSKAYIDLSDTEKTSVIIDNQLELD